MNQSKEVEFLDIFEELSDRRSERNRLYSMWEILLVTVCGIICGAERWQDIEDFGKVKLEELKDYLPFKKGIPSDDTFRRFFRAIDPHKFQELFRHWIHKLIPEFNDKVIAIDGKSSRHSFDGEKPMLHMISAYATEMRLVLAQEKVFDKSNEITAIPKLLEWLDLKGNTVTIDAMGCQHKIAEAVRQKEGHYIFALKGNQSSLKEDISLYLQDPQTLKDLDSHHMLDKGHGRMEEGTCSVSHTVQWIHERHQKWQSIQTIIRIDTKRITQTKTSTETLFYIASQSLDPKKALQMTRSHWAIENNLHWVLDMCFGEDHSRIRKQNAPQVMAVLRHIVLNMLQNTKNSMKRMSIKRLRKIAGWDPITLRSILSQNFS